MHLLLKYMKIHKSGFYADKIVVEDLGQTVCF